MSSTATRALVVGGAGFVGSNVVLELLHRGAEQIVVVDNLLSAERENVPLILASASSRDRSPMTVSWKV